MEGISPKNRGREVYNYIGCIRVNSIASAVSTRWQSLREVSSESDEVLKKFVKTTGVEGRWVSPARQTTSDLCYAAAEHILVEKNIPREKVGVLVFLTQTADYETPSTACVLHERLKLDKECMAFDVNLGCSGFTYGLTIAGSLLSTSKGVYALVLVGDTLAKRKSEKTGEKKTHAGSMLFGDAGSATLLERVENSELISSSCTDGSGYKAIVHPYGWWRNPDYPSESEVQEDMDDIAVFNFATLEASAQIKRYMEATGTTPDDYDCLVLHQANRMIMKRIAKKTGFPDEKNLVSIDTFANTSGASIPVTLTKHFGDLNDDRRLKVLCCGYGVGLSWSTAAIEINVRDIFPVIHTDDYYVDGFIHE